MAEFKVKIMAEDIAGLLDEITERRELRTKTIDVTNRRLATYAGKKR